MSTVRLNEIVLVSLNEYPEYLHFCALHPDLQVVKLVIPVDQSMGSECSFIQDDMVSLFQMPTLQDISISGCWGHFKEMKTGLTQGLQQQPYPFPLRKLCLDTESGGYNDMDFKDLWDAIFSFPARECRDQLEIHLGQEFTGMMRQAHSRDLIYESWIQFRSDPERKLKSIDLTEPNHVTVASDYDILSHIAQT